MNYYNVLVDSDIEKLSSETSGVYYVVKTNTLKRFYWGAGKTNKQASKEMKNFIGERKDKKELVVQMIEGLK